MLKLKVGCETNKQLLEAAAQTKFLDYSYDLNDFAKK
jgi:hypothetical protein